MGFSDISCQFINSQFRGRITTMKNGNSLNRDRLITILLILAGIVLALMLFTAGAVWRGRGHPLTSTGQRFPVSITFNLLMERNHEYS